MDVHKHALGQAGQNLHEQGCDVGIRKCAVAVVHEQNVARLQRAPNLWLDLLERLPHCPINQRIYLGPWKRIDARDFARKPLGARGPGCELRGIAGAHLDVALRPP